jgi:geranylgeranylglycerol-phosphate geranylgeranyltransferase
VLEEKKNTENTEKKRNKDSALSLVKEMRLLNALIAGGVVILGGYLTPAYIGIHIYLAALSVVMITIAGNLINDYFDVETDEINRPERPIPSGRLKKKQALLISISLFISGNVLLTILDLNLLKFGLTTTFLLVIYTPVLKKHPLIGNITVSFLLSLTIIVGAVASAAFLNLKNSILPASLIFFLNLPREILKDGEDFIGDRKAGLRTFPVVFGIRRTRNLVIFTLWILILWICFNSIIFGKLFAACAIPGIVLPVLIMIKRAKATPTWFGNAQRILKLLIVPGVISLILSRI